MCVLSLFRRENSKTTLNSEYETGPMLQGLGTRQQALWGYSSGFLEWGQWSDGQWESFAKTWGTNGWSSKTAREQSYSSSLGASPWSIHSMWLTDTGSKVQHSLYPDALEQCEGNCYTSVTFICKGITIMALVGSWDIYHVSKSRLNTYSRTFTIIQHNPPHPSAPNKIKQNKKVALTHRQNYIKLHNTFGR